MGPGTCDNFCLLISSLGRIPRAMLRLSLHTVPAVGVASCAPVVQVAGAAFPGWMLCVLVGVLLTVAVRFVIAALSLEAHLRPLPLVYLGLALTFTFATWLLFFVPR